MQHVLCCSINTSDLFNTCSFMGRFLVSDLNLKDHFLSPSCFSFTEMLFVKGEKVGKAIPTFI